MKHIRAYSGFFELLQAINHYKHSIRFFSDSSRLFRDSVTSLGRWSLETRGLLGLGEGAWIFLQCGRPFLHQGWTPNPTNSKEHSCNVLWNWELLGVGIFVSHALYPILPLLFQLYWVTFWQRLVAPVFVGHFLGPPLGSVPCRPARSAKVTWEWCARATWKWSHRALSKSTNEW